MNEAATARGDDNMTVSIVAMATCPLAFAATDASRGAMLAVVMALCLLLSGACLNLLRPWTPAVLLLPLLLFTVRCYSFFTACSSPAMLL